MVQELMVMCYENIGEQTVEVRQRKQVVKTNGDK